MNISTLPEVSVMKEHNMVRTRGIEGYSEAFGLETAGLIKWLNKFERVGDIGSGKGNFLEEVRESKEINAQIVGIDIVAEKNEKKDLAVQGRIEQMPFKNDSLDAVVSSHGAFYYAENENALEMQAKEMSRVIRKDGELLIVLSPKDEKNVLKAKAFSLIRSDGTSFDANVIDVLRKNGFKELARKVSGENEYRLAVILKKE